MKPIYYYAADHSFWRSTPPDGSAPLAAEDAEIVEAALVKGWHPRPDGAHWKVYTSADPPPDVLLFGLRQRRDRLLRESDRTQLHDVRESLTPEQRQAWRQYRRDLRDLPSNYQHGQAIVWPAKPE